MAVSAWVFKVGVSPMRIPCPHKMRVPGGTQPPGTPALDQVAKAQLFPFFVPVRTGIRRPLASGAFGMWTVRTPSSKLASIS